MRHAGLENDQQSGVICRFKHPDSDLLLDVMPTEASILGFENRWQAEAFPHAIEVELPAGQVIRAIPPAYQWHAGGTQARRARKIAGREH